MSSLRHTAFKLVVAGGIAVASGLLALYKLSVEPVVLDDADGLGLLPGSSSMTGGSNTGTSSGSSTPDTTSLKRSPITSPQTGMSRLGSFSTLATLAEEDEDESAPAPDMCMFCCIVFMQCTGTKGIRPSKAMCQQLLLRTLPPFPLMKKSLTGGMVPTLRCRQHKVPAAAEWKLNERHLTCPLVIPFFLRPPHRLNLFFALHTASISDDQISLRSFVPMKRPSTPRMLPPIITIILRILAPSPPSALCNISMLLYPCHFPAQSAPVMVSVVARPPLPPPPVHRQQPPIVVTAARQRIAAIHAPPHPPPACHFQQCDAHGLKRRPHCDMLSCIHLPSCTFFQIPPSAHVNLASRWMIMQPRAHCHLACCVSDLLTSEQGWRQVLRASVIKLRVSLDEALSTKIIDQKSRSSGQ